MMVRTISGIVMSAILIGVMFLGKAVVEAVLYVFIAVCAYEVCSALKKRGIHLSASAVAFFVVLLPVAIHVTALKGILALFMITGMLTLAMQVFRADLAVEHTAYTFFVLFYPCMMMSMIPLMFTFPGYGGYWAMICTVLMASFTDMFALYVGLLFGKHKLCPSISPKKTVEGALGGLLGGLVVGVGMGLVMKQHFLPNTIVWHMIILGVICSMAGQVGDLCASIVKRSTGIKDFGNFIPGHGGLMDRADSIQFVAPIVYCYFSLILYAA